MSKAIRNEDFVFEMYPIERKDGMQVGSMSSGVKVIHRPTGVEFVSKDERSQHRNKDKAFNAIIKHLDGLGWDTGL